MKTDFKKSFLHDIKKIKDKILLEKIEQTILTVELAETKQDIPELKKLKGNKKGIYYRIQVNNHRIGVTIKDNMITFVVFKARKDVYKFFP